MRRHVWLFVPLLAGLACEKKDPVLARVGSRTITAVDFKKEVEGVPFTSQAYLRTPAGRKELLELLVRRKIILEEVGSKPPNPETKNLLAELDKHYQEQKKLLRERYVEEQERLLVGQYTKSLKDGPLKITDDDVRLFWEKEKEVRGAHILVSDRALAEEIRKKISAGETFDALAKKYSEDAPSAAKGGDAGYLLPGSLVPEFENALFALRKGDISNVVVSPYGFHIVRRGDDRPLSAQPLDDEMKTRLRRTLENRKLQAWFETIRQRHVVRVNNENLQEIVIATPVSGGNPPPPQDRGVGRNGRVVKTNPQEDFPLKKIAMSLALSVIAVGPLCAAKLTNRPIAVVNGETILLSDFQKNWEAFQEQQNENGKTDVLTDDVKKESRQKLFDQMVDDKVLQAEAKKRKIRVPQRDLENGIMQVKARFLPENGRRDLQTIIRRQMAAQGENSEGTPDLSAAWKELAASNPAATKEAEATFKSELAKEGIDEKKFNGRIRDQLSVVQLSSEIVRERVKPPSEDAVKKLFDQLTDKMAGKDVPGLSPESAKDMESMAKYFSRMTAEQVHARHILLSVIDEKGQPTGWEKATPEEKAKVRKKMEELRKLIKGGADFASLAEKNSVDKGSAVKGGDLDFFARGQMVPAFEKAAFSLAEGQVSDIVETQFGLHLIKVIEKKAATKLRYDQAENDLREYLFRSSQQTAFEEYVGGLRKSSDVKILVSPEELAGL